MRLPSGKGNPGDYSDNTPRTVQGLGRPGHQEQFAQGDQGTQGREHPEQPEHAKTLLIYRRTHGAALGALHGQLKYHPNTRLYALHLVTLATSRTRVPYSFDTGLSSLTTPLSHTP